MESLNSETTRAGGAHREGEGLPSAGWRHVDTDFATTRLCVSHLGQQSL